jgi:predicted ATP-dependent endonuclease of OLD family
MDDSNIYIHGFGVKGYRSFGTTHQRVGPFSKVNLFLGQNNSGKSNILRFLQEHYFKVAKAAHKLESHSFDDLEVHKRLDASSEQFEVAFIKKFDDAFLETAFGGRFTNSPDIGEYLRDFLSCDIFTLDGISWLIYERNSQNQIELSKHLVTGLSEAMSYFTSSRGIGISFQQLERELFGVLLETMNVL